MKILVGGGCKNGKSFYAQSLAQSLAGGGELFYVATMAPCDDEDQARILRHRQEREGWGFLTLEQPTDISGCLLHCGEHSTLLLDSTTALLANEMFPPQGAMDLSAADRVTKELLELCHGVGNIVLVSDYIYSDAAHYDTVTEAYRRGLAAIDRTLAAHCDVVCEVAYGNQIFHKGGVAL
ncbi:MAG: bifunctional adenosylcobinamide kinase/adenosylcobinamide-phosphate guanylyltransferase [Angelakisella sp.]